MFKKFSFKNYFVILILLSLFTAMTTYMYISYFVEKAESEEKIEVISEKLDLSNEKTQDQGIFKEHINMSDFFFPDDIKDLDFNERELESLERGVLNDIWISKEEIIEEDISRKSDNIIENTLDKVK